MIWYDWMMIRGLFCILLYPSTWSNLSIVVQSSSQWDGGSAGQPCWRHAETQRKPNCMFLWKMHLRLMTTIWSPTGDSDSEKRFRQTSTWHDLTFPAILGIFPLGSWRMPGRECRKVPHAPAPAASVVFQALKAAISTPGAFMGWIWGKPFFVVVSMHLYMVDDGILWEQYIYIYTYIYTYIYIWFYIWRFP